MEKKEFKVGEVFQCGLIKLKCVKGGITCNKCYFNGICIHEIVGPCHSEGRKDKTSVIFVKVD